MVKFTKESIASHSETRKRRMACQKRKLKGFCALIKRNIAQREQLAKFEKKEREMEILRRENDARKNEVASLKEHLRDALLELKESDQVHEAVVCKMGQLRKECEDMPDELKRLKKCCDQKDHEIRRLSAENYDLRETVRHLEDRLVFSNNRHKEEVQTLKEHGTQLSDSLSAHIRQLQEQVQHLQQSNATVLSICNRQEQSISQLMEEKKVLCTKGKEPIQKALVAVQALLEIFRDPITLEVAEVDRNVLICGHACGRDYLLAECEGCDYGGGVVQCNLIGAKCPTCRENIYEEIANPCFELKNATGASLALEKMLREVLATYE
jgi:chromosome segregation ATPase